MELKFCGYLINIGLINNDSFSNIIIEFRKNHTNNNFYPNMISTLNRFIKNLSFEEKNYMSINLVKSYLKNKKKEKLKSIYMLCNEKILLTKLRFLYKWKLITVLNKLYQNNKGNNILNTLENSKSNKYKIYKRNIQRELDKNTNSYLKEKNNFDDNKYIDRFQNLFNEYYKQEQNIKTESYIKKFKSANEISNKPHKKNYSDLQTSLALKEQEELKECTFSPRINNTSKNRNSRKEDKKYNSINNEHLNDRKVFNEIFNKLHDDDNVYKNKIKMTIEKYEDKFREENTFRPKIYNNLFNRKYSQNNSSFGIRQKEFLLQKEKHSEKIKKLLEDNFSKECSFVPEINVPLNNEKRRGILFRNSNKYKKFNRNQSSSRNSSNSSTFKRLYDDSKIRTIKQNKREKDYDDYINEMVSISCRKDSKVNYDKINELYLNKKKNEIIKKTIKKVEDEEGITFTPEIHINEYAKNITSDFYERNEKFLIDKKNFIENNIKEQNKILYKDKISKNKKKK